MAEGANKPSLVDAQKHFAAFGACEERVKRFVRAPLPSDSKEAGWRPIAAAEIILEADEATGRPAYPLDRTELYYWRETFWRKRQ
jgi:hypothetical protein